MSLQEFHRFRHSFIYSSRTFEITNVVKNWNLNNFWSTQNSEFGIECIIWVGNDFWNWFPFSKYPILFLIGLASLTSLTLWQKHKKFHLYSIPIFRFFILFYSVSNGVLIKEPDSKCLTVAPFSNTISTHFTLKEFINSCFAFSLFWIIVHFFSTCIHRIWLWLVLLAY